MAKARYDYEIEIDSESKPIGKFLLWMVFVSVFVAIIAGAVWVLYISKRGLNFEPPHSTPPSQVETEVSEPAHAQPFVGVSLPVSTMTLTEGECTMLTAVLKLAPGSPYIDLQSLGVRWRSEWPGIVSVNSHGDIVAHQPGRARISVTVNDKRVDSNEAYCMVEVLPAAKKDTPVETEDSEYQIP